MLFLLHANTYEITICIFKNNFRQFAAPTASAAPPSLRRWVLAVYLGVDPDAGDGEVLDGVGDVDVGRARLSVVHDRSVVAVGVGGAHDVNVPRAPGHRAVAAARQPPDRQQSARQPRPHLSRTTHQHDIIRSNQIILFAHKIYVLHMTVHELDKQGY